MSSLSRHGLVIFAMNLMVREPHHDKFIHYNKYMNQQTALKLNKINNEFYQIVAPFFDSSRQYNWDGWERAEFVSVFKGMDNLKILDLGCGNGRYLKLINNYKLIIINYEGLDSSKELLNKAKESCLVNEAKFENVDLLLDNWEKGREGKFNLVVAFGLLHHIPSEEFRKKFFERVFSVLEDGGYFVFTVWNFNGSERQKNKIADWSKVGIDEQEVDQNDYLLSWNRGVEAYRYAHAYTHKEIANLINNQELIITNYFKSDGKEGDLNTYYIVQKVGVEEHKKEKD